MIAEHLSPRELEEYITRCRHWLDMNGWTDPPTENETLPMKVVLGKKSQYRKSVKLALAGALAQLQRIQQNN